MSLYDGQEEVSQAMLNELSILYKKGFGPRSQEVLNLKKEVKAKAREKYDLMLSKTRGNEIRKELDKVRSVDDKPQKKKKFI